MNFKIALAVATTATAACTVSLQAQPVDGCGAAYISAFETAQKMANTDNCVWDQVDTLEEAVAVQKTAVEHFTSQGAEPIGYKVTSATDGRVVGTIMSNMVMVSGSGVEVASGAALVSEADILVRVKDAGINSATTLEEVVAHLDQVIPLIESSDMMTAEGIDRTVASWTATNGNARYAFVGEPVEIDGSAEWVERFANINVVFSDETGKVMADTTMNRNPLESVLDVLASFKERGLGEELKAGDVISLGNFGRPMRPKAGQTFTAVFQGLDDGVVVANYK
jgi:2-oxo-hept-3-ene-1,7-dioate hydratase